ncbi:hypothetical protein [Microbacterium sp. NPDC076895]|uniref:hypothetical protein n=1 Tax=Microbacterium sp. NPDC076895 TaxID=3154957 RepID=UPI00341EFC2D
MLVLAALVLVFLAAVWGLAGCAGHTDAGETSRKSRDGGITQEEAEQRGVSVAGGDGRISDVVADIDAGALRLTVENVSNVDDVYRVVLLAAETVLESDAVAVPANSSVQFAVPIDFGSLRARQVDIRLDGAILGEGIDLETVDLDVP